LVGGQVDDLAAEFKIGGLAELERIHRRKTGAMFQISLRLGGLIAGGNSEEMSALHRYGTSLGLAFQIIDDLLDVKGETAEMGKRVAKDSGLGKLTFPALLGLESSEARAARLIQEAQHSLQVFGERSEPLRALAQFVLERNR
jgi:geranylgeranyl diphosphate synthase type II